MTLILRYHHYTEYRRGPEPKFCFLYFSSIQRIIMKASQHNFATFSKPPTEESVKTFKGHYINILQLLV